jgi:hypothetical protein
MKENKKYSTDRCNFKAMLFILFAASNLVHAQNISFTAEAPGAVRAGEQFQLVYTLNENVDEFTPPDFGSFKYLGGPATGSSTSIEIVNGRTSRTSTYTFTYYLQAPGAGKYTLAPATATYKKNKVQSNTLEIEVVGASQNATTGTPNNSQPNSQEASEVSSGQDIFVRLETDKKSAFVGEAISASIKIYSKLSITGIDQQFKGPDFVGFYRQDIAIPNNITGQKERVGNDIYVAYTLQKVILFPQRSGEIKIEPFDLVVEVQKQVRRQSQSIFDDFFGTSYQRSRINLKSQLVKLAIRQLPVNQPQDFNGAVGNFSINASANPKNIKTNDAVTFKVTISGKGNVKLIEGIKPDFPPAFEVYEPVVKTNIDNSGQSGTKVFEYTAIPRHAGKFTVSPFSLTFFDINEKTYKTISTQSFDINVEKGENDSTTVMVGNLTKEDVKLLGSDIRYIETKTKLHKKSEYIFGSLWFLLINLSAFLVFILILIIRNEQIRQNADAVRMRNRKAGKVAAKRLKKARYLLKTGEKDEFYEELGKALWGYLSDKLSIPLAELSKERIIQEFKKVEIDESITEQFFVLSELCEFARYAPGETHSDMPDVFNKAERLISKLDQNL